MYIRRKLIYTVMIKLFHFFTLNYQNRMKKIIYKLGWIVPSFLEQLKIIENLHLGQIEILQLVAEIKSRPFAFVAKLFLKMIEKCWTLSFCRVKPLIKKPHFWDSAGNRPPQPRLKNLILSCVWLYVVCNSSVIRID